MRMHVMLSQVAAGTQSAYIVVTPSACCILLTNSLLHTGLLHFNHNNQCTPLVFTQTFNSADPGALNVVGALAALSGTAGASIQASNVTAGASPQKAFALDQVALLAHCINQMPCDPATQI